jgi:hypothetical protein
MEPIIKELVAGLVVIIACTTSFIIAWIESKKRKLEEQKHIKTKNELTKERNGFREHVYEKLKDIDIRLKTLEGVNKKVKELKIDMQLIKGETLENKKKFNQLIGDTK